MRLGENFTARLILAIVSIALEEVALWVIWRWGLPELGIELPVSALIAVMVAWLVFSVTTFSMVTRVLRKRATVGLPTMIGSKGKVARMLAPEGMVRIKGELWGATSTEGNISEGEVVTVVGEDGLKLIVTRGGAEQYKGNR